MEKMESLKFGNIEVPVEYVRDGLEFGSFKEPFHHLHDETVYYGSTIIRCQTCGNTFIRHEFSGGNVLSGNQCNCDGDV